MQNPAEYRRYAEECRRLAQQALPEHKATLLEIAKAWIACAEEVERTGKGGKDKAGADAAANSFGSADSEGSRERGESGAR